MYVCWHTLKTSCHTFLICFCKYIPIQLSPPSPCTLPKQSSPTGFCQRKVSCYDLPAVFPVGWKYLSSSFLGVLVFCCCCFSPPATHCIFRSLALPQSIKQVSEWIHILISFGYIFAYFSFLFLFLLFCNLVIFCVFSLVIFGHLEKKSQETFLSCTSSMTLRYTTRAQTGRQISLGHTTLPFSSVSGRCGTCYWCSLNF